MSKTIRQVLEDLIIDSIMIGEGSILSTEALSVNKALAEISRLLEEAKPRIWNNAELRLDEEWVGYVNGVENYAANLEMIKG